MSTPINSKQIDGLKILLSEERLKRFISLTGLDEKAFRISSGIPKNCGFKWLETGGRGSVATQ